VFSCSMIAPHRTAPQRGWPRTFDRVGPTLHELRSVRIPLHLLQPELHRLWWRTWIQQTVRSSSAWRSNSWVLPAGGSSSSLLALRQPLVRRAAARATEPRSRAGGIETNPRVNSSAAAPTTEAQQAQQSDHLDVPRVLLLMRCRRVCGVEQHEFLRQSAFRSQHGLSDRGHRVAASSFHRRRAAIDDLSVTSSVRTSVGIVEFEINSVILSAMSDRCHSVALRNRSESMVSRSPTITSRRLTDGEEG